MPTNRRSLVQRASVARQRDQLFGRENRQRQAQRDQTDGRVIRRGLELANIGRRFHYTSGIEIAEFISY
jgi:hypothetical protein